MGTVAEKLEYLTETKQLIADAVNAKGGDITPATPFREYADQINGLAVGGEKKVFNVTVDQVFGAADENGKYARPLDGMDIDLTGVKRGLYKRMFSYWGGGKGLIKRFYAPDLEEIPSSCFYVIGGDEGSNLDSFEFYAPKVVKVEDSAFGYLTSYMTIGEGRFNFGSLESVGAGSYYSYVFYSMFRGIKKVELVQRIFPKLRFVYGNSMFGDFLSSNARLGETYNIPSAMFPSLEEFYGPYGSSDITSEYSCVFGDLYAKIFLPKCTKVPTWVFKRKTDSETYVYTRELHFAIKNRAAIEACNGFNNNFGASGVFFDLVSAITVNDVVYQRSEENSITETFEKFYTAWKSDGGDIVYTYDGNYTVEPAVGTDVFSDGGQTVVGTVSAIE